MSLDFQIQKFNYVLSVNGKLLEVPLRRGRADSAFIDYNNAILNTQLTQQIE